MTALPFEWAVAGRPLNGQLESGDLHVVEPFKGGVLVGVIDGLGHGAQAAEASHLARSALREDASADVDELFARCNERLLRTRGAVMTLASLHENPDSLSWAAVGNVEGVLLRGPRRESVMMWSGFLGNGTTRPRVSSRPLESRDLLLLATDGLKAGFAEGVSQGAPVQAIADELLERHGRSSDDALVLVARWRP